MKTISPAILYPVKLTHELPEAIHFMTRRVFIRLVGGAGNQLFQYATARAVAEKNRAELLLDARETHILGGKHPYALEHFNIQARIASESELPPHRSRKLRYLSWRYLGRNPRFVREKGLGFNANVLTLGPNCYLHGYFQSEQYFNSISHILREELRIVSQSDTHNRKILEDIKNCNSVALHIRRGDYLSSGSKIYAACKLSYYEGAIAHIYQQSGPMILYVFSDDPDWVRKNLKTEHPIVFSDQNQGERYLEDLRLMSSCKHNIIANSTFSWWGAWLNPDPAKIVVAPSSWFIDKSYNPDIIPADWYQLGRIDPPDCKPLSVFQMH